MRVQASTMLLNAGLAPEKSLPALRAGVRLRRPEVPGPHGPVTSGDRAKGDQPLRRFFSALAAENFAAFEAEI